VSGRFGRERFLRVLRVACLLVVFVMGARDSAAQLTPTDSAAVLLDAARDFEAQGQREVADALYRLIVERYPTSEQAGVARAQLAARPVGGPADDGSVELRVWMTLYGAALGGAIPAAFGADSAEPYGIGLLVGGPAGFFGGRALANALDLTAGQARVITLAGTWGAWQGWGWREVFEWGVPQQCDFGPDFCYDTEDAVEEQLAAAIFGSVAGVGIGTLLSRRDVRAGTASVANFAALWGSWFGFAGGDLFDLEDDDLLAAALVGGNVGLVASALLAPGWNVSRSRARLVSIAGVLGGTAGLGVDLLVQPDNPKVALGIPLAGSILGLGVGIVATRADTVNEALGDAPDAALVRLRAGRLAFGAPGVVPALVPRAAGARVSWHPALRMELFRAVF
jgi:hypothetical protein